MENIDIQGLLSTQLQNFTNSFFFIPILDEVQKRKGGNRTRNSK